MASLFSGGRSYEDRSESTVKLHELRRHQHQQRFILVYTGHPAARREEREKRATADLT